MKVNDTFVCWNIDDCPVPVDTDLGSIVNNFEHALHQMGFAGRMSINVDCKKLNSNEEALFKAGRIFYLPYGKFLSRFYLIIRLSYYLTKLKNALIDISA